MKKSLFVLGVAVAAFASCTNEEVISVPENAAIGFSSFVNNTTKALPTSVDKDNFKKFYVYGDVEKTSNSWTDLFTNVEVTGESVGSNAVWTPTQTAYWTASVNHNFGAYANGTAAPLTNETNVSFDPATVALTFTNYTAGTNDLVAATAKNQTWDGANNPSNVQLSFKHMLSKVRITFKTKDSEDYKYEVTDLKISNAVATATGNYTDGTVGAWNGNADGTYEFDLEKLGDFAAAGTADGDFYSELFVIPQTNTSLNATFTIKAYDSEGDELDENTFTASLNYQAGTGSSVADGTTAGSWTAGYAYNYTATISLPDITEDDDKPILFDVTAVEGWETATDVTLTPTTQGN